MPAIFGQSPVFAPLREFHRLFSIMSIIADLNAVFNH